jgi:hypothetical protein
MIRRDRRLTPSPTNNTLHIILFMSVVTNMATVKIVEVMKSSVFCDITPCSPLKVNQRFGGTCRLHLQGRRICQARNQRGSRWKAQMSINCQRTIGRYMPEDRTLHYHRCENLKSFFEVNIRQVYRKKNLYVLLKLLIKMKWCNNNNNNSNRFVLLEIWVIRKWAYMSYSEIVDIKNRIAW